MYYFLVSLNILRSEADFGHLKFWDGGHFLSLVGTPIQAFSILECLNIWHNLFIKFWQCPPNPHRFHYPYFVTRCNGPDRYVIYENSFRVEAERIAYVLVFVCLEHNFKYKCISIYFEPILKLSYQILGVCFCIQIINSKPFEYIFGSSWILKHFIYQSRREVLKSGGPIVVDN